MRDKVCMLRKMDELGRFVIPMELRKVLNINRGDALEFCIEGEKLILRKYIPTEDSMKVALEKIREITNSLRYKAPEEIHGTVLAQAVYNIANAALNERNEKLRIE